MIKKYTKQPITIEAIQWTGENAEEIAEFCGDQMHRRSKSLLTIFTLEGVYNAAKGDWIIKGIQGEFYPCKPDIFEKSYKESK